MTDVGYADVTTACPVGACEGTDIVRVFGIDGNSYYRTVKCSTCGEYYGVKVVMTVEGTITEYTLEVPA